ncbi:MAG TPA: hypothetical protein VII11_09935, partial [Bacteroidota bacterium]
QLAQKIVLVLRDEKLRARLSREALAWAKSFRWEDSADTMLGLLERTVHFKQSGGAGGRG